jgi:hypothetical protein
MSFQTTTETTTETMLSETDAHPIVSMMNDLQRRYDASKSETMKARMGREMSKLVAQLGARIATQDERGRWHLVLTAEEQAVHDAMKRQYMVQDMRNALDRAKKDYRAGVKNMMDRLQRELNNADQDYYQDANSAYGWSGAHDLPVLLERINQLMQLVKFAETGEYWGW